MPIGQVDSKRVLRLYVVAIVAAAIAALAVSSMDSHWVSSERFPNGLIAILAVALAAEISSVTLDVGSSTLSIAFIPFLAAAFLFPQFWAMLIGGFTFFCVEYFVRRKPWIKVVFNTSKEILSVGLAASVYQALGGSPSVDEFRLLPFAFVATSLTYMVSNSTMVCFAVSLSEGLDFTETWGRMYGGALVYDLLATPIPASLAYLYVEHQLLGVVGLTVPLFVVRHIYVQNLRLERSGREMLDLMVKQVELVEPYTSGHSRRVAQYAKILAKEAGIHGRQVEQIAIAALLHDVGKVYEEFAPLLRKQGKLTPEEKSLLETHPVRSAELVTTISNLRGPVELAIRHHHENYDGTGYPAKLSGRTIPVGARIIMIADTLDAMTTDRPYRKALPFDKVVEELRKFSGMQFDPSLVEIAVSSAAIRHLALGVAQLKQEPSARPVRGQIYRAEKATA